MKTLWKPIGELGNRYTPNLLICAPELVDLDFNEEGISQGFYSDMAVFATEPREDGGYNAEPGWVGIGWDGCNDEPMRVVCNPTHFLIIEGPAK